MNKKELITVILSEVNNICDEGNINVEEIDENTEIFGDAEGNLFVYGDD